MVAKVNLALNPYPWILEKNPKRGTVTEKVTFNAPQYGQESMWTHHHFDVEYFEKIIHKALAHPRSSGSTVAVIGQWPMVIQKVPKWQRSLVKHFTILSIWPLQVVGHILHFFMSLVKGLFSLNMRYRAPPWYMTRPKLKLSWFFYQKARSVTVP